MEKFWKLEHTLCTFLMYLGALISLELFFSPLRGIVENKGRNRLSNRETLNVSVIIFHLSYLWSAEYEIK